VAGSGGPAANQRPVTASNETAQYGTARCGGGGGGVVGGNHVRPFNAQTNARPQAGPSVSGFAEPKNARWKQHGSAPSVQNR